MKILYVACKNDPLDINSGSSADYEFFQAFVREKVDVSIVGPFREHSKLLSKLVNRIAAFSKKRPVKYSRKFLVDSGKAVNLAIKKIDPDIVFSFYGAPLVYCNSEKPILYSVDTTLIESQREWPIYSNPAYHSMLKWEKDVFFKAAKIICRSEATKESVIKDYSIDPEKVSFFPIPAAIPDDVVPDQIEISNRLSSPLHLLLVGKDYFRKGVDIAIDIVEQLNSIGQTSELRVVGMNGTDTRFVKFMGLYNKSVSDQLKEYTKNYLWADFLIHPARFEAAGIVPSEAAAFGVPTITNNIGGLGTTVKDKVSGVVLPKNSSAKKYVDEIMYFISHKGEYLDLCRSARKRYETELNWIAAGKHIIEIAAGICR